MDTKLQVQKVYDSKEAEPRIIKFWEKEGIYNFNSKTKKKIYSVDTPPPTVSGKMHIGHAFSYSQQDFLVRFKRMKGFEIFYPFGTDDNGLPTERLIEKTNNIRARDMPRDEFVQLCLTTLKNKLIPEYIKDWKNIGISCDWNIIYSTISEHSRKISQWSFLDLYKKQRIYRKDAPSMWCPECRTGISQVECEDKKTNSFFNTIIFKVGKEDLKIDTTRPELLPACVAIFYNPSDKRYKKLKGKMAKVPLMNFEVPIMEDARAEVEKGTGIVMCCTFGDQTDMDWQRAYNLPIKEAIDSGGKMTQLCGKYAGMKIHEARKEIITDLKNSKLLTEQKPIEHDVKVHERCGTEIEFIKSKQWFVKYLDLKGEMLKWGKELNWYPEFMYNRYASWVNGLQWDWLISRQRFFGVPFPVWYCKKCGEVILADEKDLPLDPLKNKPNKKCPKCGGAEFEGEKDILDTWFTSSMTPRLAIELMDESIRKKLFPLSLRPQASEIITFWLFNTVVKSNLHYGKKPFDDVAVSGFVTLGGQKMSKSRGNIVEPQEIIQKSSADALRYWASSSKLGEDVEYQEKEIVAGTRFINKIYNATKFIFANMQEVPKKPKKLQETDRIFLYKLNETIENSTKNFEVYNYSQSRLIVDKFFWMNLCDNYLEIVKNRVYNGTKEEKESANWVLYNSLLSVVKMMAPITPFITEEIYQEYFKKYEGEKSIHICSWPKVFEIKSEKNEDIIWNKLCEILGKVRQAKSEAKKSMKAEIILTLSKQDKKLIENCILDLKAVTNSKEIKEGEFRVEIL